MIDQLFKFAIIIKIINFNITGAKNTNFNFQKLKKNKK